ncbi:hypothetical protein [Streptomyces sp. NPDC001020]
MSVSESHDGVGAGRSRRTTAARLSEELSALGRSLDSASAGGSEPMAERVMAQIRGERLPVPVAEPPGAGERLRAVRHWTRTRWRSLTAALCGLLMVLALTSPVRAAVLDWFEFGGVQVRHSPSTRPSPGAEVPGCGRSVSLAQARHQAGFAPVVPDALGPPDTVTVTGEPHRRFLVSLCWREHGHTIRLDEYPAQLDVGFAKTVSEPPEWILPDDNTSDPDMPHPLLWFPRPHLLSFWLVDADGKRYTRKERTAGPTLLWTHQTPGREVTLRLEGVASKSRAVDIARSLAKKSGASSK